MSMQIRDYLIDGGEPWMIAKVDSTNKGSDISPLGVWLAQNNLLEYIKKGLTWEPGNYRGYRCRWYIEEEYLYLASFESRSQRLNTIDQLMMRSPMGEFSECRALNVAVADARRLLDTETRRQIKLKNTERTQIESVIEKLHNIALKVAPLPREDDRDTIGFFPEDTGRECALWFSGTINIYMREPQCDTDLNGFIYTIKSGKVIDKTPAYIRRPRI